MALYYKAKYYLIVLQKQKYHLHHSSLWSLQKVCISSNCIYTHSLSKYSGFDLRFQTVQCMCIKFHVIFSP